MNIKDKTGVVWALVIGVPVLLLVVGQFTPNKDFLDYVGNSIPVLISFAVGLDIVYIAFMTQFY